MNYNHLNHDLELTHDFLQKKNKLTKEQSLMTYQRSFLDLQVCKCPIDTHSDLDQQQKYYLYLYLVLVVVVVNGL